MRVIRRIEEVSREQGGAALLAHRLPQSLLYASTSSVSAETTNTIQHGMPLSSLPLTIEHIANDLRRLLDLGTRHIEMRHEAHTVLVHC
jgi:hypothetical protein